MKELIKRCFNAIGVEVHKYNFHHNDQLLIAKCISLLNVDLVFDIGANRGQYARRLLRSGYRNKLISFEPIAKAFQALKHNANKFNNWEAYHLGVGSQSGNLAINVSENVYSSSVLEVTETSIGAAPDSKIMREERISMTTLNEFFKSHQINSQKIYLKLDVQGFELEVLKGASEVLSQVIAIQVELSTTPLYKGSPLYLDVITYLKNLNFDLFSVLPEFRNPNSGRLLQFDGIFVRSEILKNL